MRLPRWLGGGHGDEGTRAEHADDATLLRESRRQREQLWREKIAMDARIRALEEIAQALGRHAQ